MHTDSRPLLPVAVVIPVKNEEANLARCLERLSRFSSVVVIDSGSTDQSRLIAKRYGANILDFNWNGGYPKKRNWFLLNHPPTQPWVMFLDADEFVDDAFCDCLEAVLLATDFDGFWLTYRNNFLGKELRHGIQQRKLALFRVGKALYERIDDDAWSSLDMEVHEHPILLGKVGRIRVAIEHRDFSGLSRFLEKHRNYAQWEASRYAALRLRPEAWREFTPRQRFKYNHIVKWWYPWLYFLASYIFKCGFLDGTAGFNYAFYKAWYFHSIKLLIREAKEKTLMDLY